MIPFEAEIAAIESKFNKPGRFTNLCRGVFGTPEGAELLYMLYSVAHPADHTFIDDPRQAAHIGGWREVMAALWRHSSSTGDPPVLSTEP